MQPFDAQTKPCRILIIDDDPISNRLLQSMLRAHGYANIHILLNAHNLEVDIGAFRPDLVLVNLRLPETDGFSVHQRILQYSGSDFLPVVMITAQGTQQTKLSAFRAGINGFVAKPFDQVDVLSQLHNLLSIRSLYRVLRKRNSDLKSELQNEMLHAEELQGEIIDRLLRAVEFRDGETGQHIHRVQWLVHAIARRLGLPEAQCEIMAEASRLHDIGKIGIADAILQKEGPLDQAQWEEIKSHTTKGDRMLHGSHSEVLHVAQVIARSHHENWDGSGYPDGLAGADIPLAARITAVADVFDALVSDRPYKKAWSPRAARDNIREEAGRKFDPAVSEAFLSLDERELDQAQDRRLADCPKLQTH